MTSLCDLVLFLSGEYETAGQFTALVTLRGDTGNPEDIVVAMAGESDGLVEDYSSALLHCCEMDEEYWTINGEVEIDNEGCVVATQLETFDSLKALNR